MWKIFYIFYIENLLATKVPFLKGNINTVRYYIMCVRRIYFVFQFHLTCSFSLLPKFKQKFRCIDNKWDALDGHINLLLDLICIAFFRFILNGDLYKFFCFYEHLGFFTVVCVNLEILISKNFFKKYIRNDVISRKL